jgi:hypothetical protein
MLDFSIIIRKDALKKADKKELPMSLFFQL